MTDVETGYKAVAYIWQDESAYAEGNVPLGTDVDEGSTAPTVGNWEKIVGVTSIGLPFDNSPIDIPEMGTRIIQKVAGALGISSRLEKWLSKGDTEYMGAVLGAYATATKKYSKGDSLVGFKIRVYTEVPLASREALTAKYTSDGLLDTAMGVYDSCIELTGVKLGSYDTTKEPNAGIKETIAYTAEQPTVTKYSA